MVDISNLPKLVSNDNLNSLLAANSSSGNFSWIFYLIIVLVILCLILFIFWIFRRLRFKLQSIPSDVKSLLNSGEASLAIGDIDSAKNIYNQLKKIAEESKNPEITRKTLEFYNKLYRLISKK